MRSYTVHRARRGSRPDAVDFVPDGFSTGAFVFGLFWLAYQRLWLALAIIAMVVAVLAGIEYAAGLPAIIGGALSLLTGLLLGFEGNQLRRWTLERNGRPALAVVTAKSLDEAEIRYFSGLATGSGQVRAGIAAPVAPSRAVPAGDAGGGTVLGLFPTPGGRA